MRFSNENSPTEKHFAMSVSDVSKEIQISYNEYHFCILKLGIYIMHKTVCEGKIYFPLSLFSDLCV